MMKKVRVLSMPFLTYWLPPACIFSFVALATVDTGFNRLNLLFETGKSPTFEKNQVRAGRCFSELSKAIGVYLVVYNSNEKSHAMLMARQLPDGNFANIENEDLDNPSGLAGDIDELHGAIGELISSQKYKEFELVPSNSEVALRRKDGSNYRYRINGQKLLTKIERQSNGPNIELCEFGKIVL